MLAIINGMSSLPADPAAVKPAITALLTPTVLDTENVAHLKTVLKALTTLEGAKDLSANPTLSEVSIIDANQRISIRPYGENGLAQRMTVEDGNTGFVYDVRDPSRSSSNIQIYKPGQPVKVLEYGTVARTILEKKFERVALRARETLSISSHHSNEAEQVDLIDFGGF